mmetsp:Transcript_2839/g.4435  ORF Transcript_2839/g.4435 Transcript_2839/m.4435 type:complete len:210 (+) Transcript_2839:54-683(+)
MESFAEIARNEEVGPYVRAEILPTLTPALQALLHKVVDSGVLAAEARAAEEARAAAKEKPQRKKRSDKSRRHRDKKDDDGAETSEGGPGSEQQSARSFRSAPSTSPKTSGRQPGDDGDPLDEAAAQPSAQALEIANFNPLVWLSDHLRQFAKPPGPGVWREHFAKRIQERDEKRAAEKAAAEEAARQAALGEGAEDIEAEETDAAQSTA